MEGRKRMDMCRIFLKILMWILIAGFGCNIIMQTVSYSFYKNAKQMKDIVFEPEHIQFNAKMSGFGYNLDVDSDNVILFFGGSNYIAYNSVGKFGGLFNCPFIAADYYGSQNSKGKMNLKSIKLTATDLYHWASETYPNKKIIVIGHSYGTGMATYLASKEPCDALILLAAYRDLADLYNKIIPIFWGPTKIFISNNILLREYAKTITCDTYIIGSRADKTLSAGIQEKVKYCFNNAQIKIFDNIEHENYLKEEQVIDFISDLIVDRCGR
jgi:pimeloyl-ACP methyl ester carboxylesterase